jgi:hypothetical protein
MRDLTVMLALLALVNTGHAQEIPTQLQSWFDGMGANNGSIEDYVFHLLGRLLDVFAQFIGQLFMYGVDALKALLPGWFGQ